MNMTIAQKKKFLVDNLSLLPDEAETLLATNEAVESAFEDFKKLSKISTSSIDSDGEGEHVDEYDISASTKSSRKARAEALKAQRNSTRTIAKEKFEEMDQSKFPEPEKVSFAEFYSSLKKGEDLT